MINTTLDPCRAPIASKGEGSALVNLSTLYANGWGVPRDPQRARSLLVQASRSSDPYYARAARERLGQSSGGSSAGKGDGDALLGAALVGLLLYAAFSGGGSGSDGGGGGGSMSMSSGGTPASWGGGSSTLGPCNRRCGRPHR